MFVVQGWKTLPGKNKKKLANEIVNPNISTRIFRNTDEIFRLYLYSHSVSNKFTDEFKNKICLLYFVGISLGIFSI